jgi:carboxyl-terminal processing protease
MAKTLRVAALSLSLLIIGFVLFAAVGRASSTGANDAYRQFGVMSEVLTRIQSEYVEEPNIPRVTQGALHGLLEALDSNSSYLSPAEYKEYLQKKDTRGTIGAALAKRFGYVAVIAVIPGGPADKADLESGDVIESVEGKSTRDMGLPEVEHILDGEPGSTVHIEVVKTRRVDPVKLALTREIVPVPPVTDKTVEPQVGYIRVLAVTPANVEQVAARIKELERSGTRKLILDLRDAADGDPAAGVSLANLFLDHGVITYVQGQKYPKQVFNADPQKAITKLPLAVLVNRGTAGAAEIVAAALLDNGRADLVGDRTFGMDSVQKTIDLPNGGAIILSVAKYYTPAGKEIQDHSITPNVLIANQSDNFIPDSEDLDVQPSEVEPAKPKEDLQLKRAIEVLMAKDQKAKLAPDAAPAAN